MHPQIKPIGPPPSSVPVMGHSHVNPVDPNKIFPATRRYIDYRRPRTNPHKDYTLKSASLPLEEAAKLEVSRIETTENNKTAVNIIQELLSRRRTVPTYEIVQVEGSLNEPLFKYQLTVKSSTKTYVGKGGGRSKKEAKQNAAKNVLNQLLGLKEDPKLANNKTAVKNDNAKMNGVDKTVKLLEPNPISLLQESCFARRWPAPYYETESPHGLPHERVYSTNVYVDKYRESGVGKTKKISKREAAKVMLAKLKAIPVSPIDYKKLYEETHSSQNSELESTLKSLKEANYVLMTIQQTKKIAQFHQKVKNNKGPKLEALKHNISNQKDFDAVSYLQEIGKEQRFEITFVEIEDKSLSGEYQALVQLATFPVAVCHGKGKTQQDAKMAAAHNAVEYLRLMTKSK